MLPNRSWKNLKTISAFDDDPLRADDDDINYNETERAARRDLISRVSSTSSTPVSLLVESLIEYITHLIESNNKEAQNLYRILCEPLCQMRLIDETYSMKEFDVLRTQYQEALHHLISAAKGGNDPVIMDNVWPFMKLIGQRWSRFAQEFEELKFINSGAFGKVFRCRNKLDGIEYAVKKITIRATTINQILPKLAEVKTMASLHHINIVPYKAAWLEPLLAEEINQNVTHANVSLEEIEEYSSETGETDGYRSNRADFSMVSQASSDFIQFVDSTAPSDIGSGEGETTTQSNSIGVQNLNLAMESNLSHQLEHIMPHKTGTWATLYIQMALCELTLDDWLNESYKHDTRHEFYLNSFYNKNSITNNETGDSETNLNPEEFHLGTVNEIFQQLLNGLDYIHSRGIVHHDIKPSNIFLSITKANSLSEQGKITAHLGDFGLACLLDKNHGKRHSGRKIGTDLYGAPEQLDEGLCDPKSDIYSLGLVLLELLHHFHTKMERNKHNENARKGIIPSNTPTEFKNILNKLLLSVKERPTVKEVMKMVSKMHINRDKEVFELERRLSVQENQLVELHENLRNKDKVIEDRDNEIKAKDNEIEKLRRTIECLKIGVQKQ